MQFTNPDQKTICQILREVHTIAVVGLSPNPSRPAHGVARALQGFGYRIVPVRPLIDKVLGEQAYPDLENIPFPVDIVEVFRAPEHIPAIVESCIRLGIKRLWLQDGVIHEAAALHAQQTGIQIVMDRCMYRDFTQLCRE
jgi:predicted CoA-binding protein